jgi:hypothetical protein
MVQPFARSGIVAIFVQHLFDADGLYLPGRGKPCSFVLVYLGTNAIGKTPPFSRFVGLFVHILPDCAIIG